MRVLVPIKRVVDYNVRIRLKPDGSGVDTQHVRMSINPFDEIAVEEAIRLKERSVATEVVVVSIGDKMSQDIIRHGLALGADRGILIETPETPEPLDIAKLLKAIIMEESPDLVILGKQAIDDDCNQVGQMLAGLLNWPQGTFASHVGDFQEGWVRVAREVDGGIEHMKVRLPAVITTDLRLNQPRYASLPNIMKAKQKPLAIRTLADMGYALRKKQQTLTVTEPPKRKRGITVASVAELVSHLKQAGICP